MRKPALRSGLRPIGRLSNGIGLPDTVLHTYPFMLITHKADDFFIADGFGSSFCGSDHGTGGIPKLQGLFG
jgi:hypothetical protein